MKFLRVLCVLGGLTVCAQALDRDAFTFTHYDLNVTLDPALQRIGVRGTITLRNDSQAAQQNLSLQISSSLTWRSIQLDHEPLEFTPQDYTSDIDHTGSLSEAIVTLPKSVPPKGVVKLNIGYEGIVRGDGTRLARIGVPEKAAKDTDWDRISAEFTAVRGIGYVTWYPIAAESANLSEGNNVFAVVERWKNRHRDSSMSVSFADIVQPLFFSGVQKKDANLDAKPTYEIQRFGTNVPVFAVADYKTLSTKNGSINYLAGKEDAAKAYANFISTLYVPMLPDDANLQVLQLPDGEAAPFVSGSFLLSPLDSSLSTDAKLNIVYALAQQAHDSQRSWIHEGLAHFAQLSYIEQVGSHSLVLSYLAIRRQLLANDQRPSKADSSRPTNETSESLINSGDDPKSQIKSMWVFWMLQDMCGDSFINDFMQSYKQDADKEPSYAQRIAQTACKKDLEWFFDDWIYRDKGLPDLHIASVFPRKNLKEGYLTTVTIENLGSAGAEVPVTLHDPSGDFTERVIVKAKSQASVRFSTTGLPDEVKVNDGGVPESDVSNNDHKIEPGVPETH